VHLVAESAQIVGDADGEGECANRGGCSGDGVRLWESEADFGKFAEEQLMPAVQKLLEERGFTLAGGVFGADDR